MSTGDPPPPSLNGLTRLPHQFKELPLDNRGLERAYELAKKIHEKRPPREAELPGYTLYCVLGENVRAFDLLAEPHTYFVVGRHTHCDIVLDAEPTIALRHLLVRAIVRPDGSVGIRVMDLHTTLGFHVDGGKMCRSIFAVGPIALRVGPYAILALPVASAPMPERLPVPTKSEAASVERSPQGGPYRALATRDPQTFRSSHITVLPRLPALEDLPERRSSQPGFGRLTLDSGKRVASVEVSEVELDAGVLIGRALKCKDDGLRSVLDLSISRAHLLLLREAEETSAFDLASVRGTFVHGNRARRVPLPDTGGALRLAHPNGLRLYWRKDG